MRAAKQRGNKTERQEGGGKTHLLRARCTASVKTHTLLCQDTHTVDTRCVDTSCSVSTHTLSTLGMRTHSSRTCVKGALLRAKSAAACASALDAAHQERAAREDMAGTSRASINCRYLKVWQVPQEPQSTVGTSRYGRYLKSLNQVCKVGHLPQEPPPSNVLFYCLVLFTCSRAPTSRAASLESLSPLVVQLVLVVEWRCLKCLASA